VHQVSGGDHGAMVAVGGGVPGVRHLVIAALGSYVRQMRVLPLGGHPVLIHLAMRRFSGQNPACEKVTLAGQADALTVRYQRWSVPLAGLLAQIALELAGRAGMRLARALGIAVHRGTLLRLVIDLPEPAVTAAPQVLGVDLSGVLSHPSVTSDNVA